MKARGMGGPDAELSKPEVSDFLAALLEDLSAEKGRPARVLLVPPDQTRANSQAGLIVTELARRLGPALAAILPATGTHRPMGRPELGFMYPGLDPELFLSHDHRKGVKRLGEIEPGFVEAVSKGKLSFPFPGDFNRSLVEGGWDCIISIGQVVPHEVAGMANYTKNLVVGLGGASAIDLSHWLGAVEGLESIMGRRECAVRSLLDESARRFLGSLPIVYLLTVVGPRPEGGLALRGLFAGEGGSGGGEAFLMASGLAAETNITIVNEPLEACVVDLDPGEFRSTWLGNKAIYRTRMALADGADLFILAPGVDRFGEDAAIDGLIRRHGYRGTGATMDAVASDPELAANLSAAAHLIHGSSEGRFRITYCTEPRMRRDIEAVGYSWMSLEDARGLFMGKPPVEGMNEGRGGRPFFYVSKPALGLWKRAEK